MHQHPLDQAYSAKHPEQVNYHHRDGNVFSSEDLRDLVSLFIFLISFVVLRLSMLVICRLG